MLSVDFLRDARRDFDESFDWYAERSTQAALRFSDAVDAALTDVVADPVRFATMDGVHCECPVKRFPFRIVFRLVDERVLVVAIAHAKRRPGYWRNRG
jgi:plasmid stabilization system protein ParE